MGRVAVLSSWLVSLFPDVQVPSWLAGLPDTIRGLNAYLDSTAVWFPWHEASVGLTFALAMVLAEIVIKIVRIVASFLTLGGGSAA
jgi:hypothetical protein